MLHRLNNLDKILSDVLGNSTNVNEFLQTRLLPVDVLENQNSYLVYADVPGVSKETIVVDFKEGVLKLEVPKQVKQPLSEGETVVINQRFNLNYKNEIVFKHSIDESSIKASVKDGVLKIEVPKKEKVEKTTKIIID
jgi:HSP20 family protein